MYICDLSRSYSLRFIFGGGPAPASCRVAADYTGTSPSCCSCLSFFLAMCSPPPDVRMSGCNDVSAMSPHYSPAASNAGLLIRSHRSGQAKIAQGSDNRYAISRLASLRHTGRAPST